jgi:aspartyl-tRNA(Asn)/glutamyl-tRNA(Gln) amidotransferase subunit A
MSERSEMLDSGDMDDEKFENRGNQESRHASRRSFLKKSATAVTGVFLAPLAESSASRAAEPQRLTAMAQSPVPQSAVPRSASQAGSAESGLDLPSLTLAGAAERLRRKQLSPVELTRAILDRIDRLNPRVGAFITVAADQAMDAARAAEQEIQRGRYKGPLHGIPIGVKDTHYTAGIRTTAASRVLADFIPGFDATVVRRLKEAGAILIGKTNLPEFSFGGYTAGTNNPWDLSRNSGGSSGGSGAALAAGMLIGATGGDTSGSIRNPAATCGVVGHKPTFGLVSRYGIVPISWTLDHIGPMGKTVEDCAILLRVLAGYDPKDSYSADVALPDYPRRLRKPVRGLRLGTPPADILAEFHPDTQTAFREAVRVLEGLGARAQEVTLPPTFELAAEAQTIVRICDAAAYHRQYLRTQAEDYGPNNPSLPPVSQVRTTVEAGLLLTAVQYLRAQQFRRVFVQQCLEMYSAFDFFLSPAMPAPADEPANPRVTFRSEYNLNGFPAISIPCGFSTSPQGLPIGLQISALPFRDAEILAFAHAYESATDWHRRKPSL